jgi:AcrR family transcriptional regulator
MSIIQIAGERVDPRVRRTRALLGQALSDVLKEKNFQAISVQDITEKAGVNRTTFYLHFQDKFALLEFNISELFRQELEKRTLNICQYSPDNLTALIITVAEFIQFTSAHCESRPDDPQFENQIERVVKNQLQDILQTWAQTVNPTSNPHRVGIAASWALYGLVLDWFHERKHPKASLFAEQITPLINAILRPEILV